MTAAVRARNDRPAGIGRGLAWTVAGGAMGFGVYALVETLVRLLPDGAGRASWDGLVLLGSPLARAYSLLSGTPLQQELAVLVYWAAIPATFVLLGAIGGWVVPRTRW